MTKDEAIQYMIKEVERIEKERLATQFIIDENQQKKKIDANQQKKGTIDAILKSLKEIKIDDEDQQN